MLKIQNGKLTNKHYAFALPQGFSIATGGDALETSHFGFYSDDKRVQIFVVFETSNGTPEEEFEVLCEDCEFIKKSDYIKVKRGKKEAVGLYYNSSNDVEEYYEELYNFDGDEKENQLCIYISFFKEENDKTTLADVLARPEIKEFWNSVEYF